MRSRLGSLALGLLGLCSGLYGLELDTTFGPIVTGVGNATLVSLALQPDQKVLALGPATFEGRGNEIALVRYTTRGALDPTFGNGGIATSYGPNAPYPAAMVLQGDGRILVAGSAPVARGTSLFVARFLADGNPDASFGSNGLAVVAFPGSNEAFARAIALMPDGQIIATGAAVYQGSPAEVFAAARFKVDGTLDPSFGSGGLVTIDMGAFLGTYSTSVVVGPGGKIVLGGLAGTASGSVMALAGLLADGTLDASFGASGRVYVPMGGATECNALLLQRDGHIVAVGNVYPIGMLAVRLHPDGSLDSTFGANGVATVPGVTATSAALDFRERIVMAGAGDFACFGVARLLPNGQPDTSVGPQGWMNAGFGGAPPNLQGQATSVVVQPDGAITLGGYFIVVDQVNFALDRYRGGSQAIPALSGNALGTFAVLLALVGMILLRR
jgi:uncharacterized delta-60 repeat protein